MSDPICAPYTEEEYAGIVECYNRSGRKLELTQMLYENNYPDRTIPKVHTIETVINKYLKSDESNVPETSNVKLTVGTDMDDLILQYFTTNLHATVRKAASIFCVQNSYIENLLEQRKTEVEAKEPKDEDIEIKEHTLNNISSQSKSASIEIEQENSDCEKGTFIDDELDNSENENEANITQIDVKYAIGRDGEIEEPIDLTEDIETAENKLLCETSFTQYSTECSDSSSNTESERMFCIQYTKKRKKKYTTVNKTKKLKNDENRSTDEDLITLESTRSLIPIVYTTRLDEMAILHKKIKHLDNLTVINMILRESKPKLDDTFNINRKKIKFKKLKKILRKLEPNEELIKLIYTYDLIKPDVTIRQKTIRLDAETCLNTTYNVVIVINNLFSNVCDMYITDDRRRLIEYCCTNLNDTKYLKQIDNTKSRLVLDVCCWMKRQQKVESIWPPIACNFYRFLRTKHTCPLNQCTCCCKLEDSPYKVSLCNTNDTYDFVNVSNNELDNFNDSRISTILKSNNPCNIRKPHTFLNQNNIPHFRYVITETSKHGNTQFIKTECIEIGRNLDIIRFHADRFFRDPRQRCMICLNIVGQCCRDVKLMVCCKWARDSFLHAQYQKSCISANTLKFLRGTQPPKMCDECKHNDECKPSQISNLSLSAAEIKHTRTSLKAKLLVHHNTNTSFRKNIPSLITNSENMKKIKTQTEIIDVSRTVKLNITCNKISKLDFVIDSVDYKIATEIVNKFKYITFTVKEDFVIAASLNTYTQSTSANELQVFARILLNIQNFLKAHHQPILPGTDFNLVAAVFPIKQVDNESSSFFNSFENFVNSNTIKSTEVFNNPVDNNDNIAEVLDDTCADINSYNKHEKKVQSTQTCSTKTKLSSNVLLQSEIKKSDNISSVISSDDEMDDINLVKKSALKPFDCLANNIRYSKKNFAESFKSYLGRKITLPKISNVFSLHDSASSAQSVTNEPIASTSKTLPPNSHIDNIMNVNNNFTPLHAQPLLLYDALTRTTRLAHLTPNGLFIPVASSSNTTNSLTNTHNNIIPVPGIMTEQNLNMINKVTMIPQGLQPEQESILPDIINDIPKNMIKEEPDDVVVLDSD